MTDILDAEKQRRMHSLAGDVRGAHGRLVQDPNASDTLKKLSKDVYDALFPGGADRFSAAEARRRVDALKREAKKITNELGDLNSQKAAVEARLHKMQVAATKFADWGMKPSKLERNDCSRLHKLLDAALNNEIAYFYIEGESPDDNERVGHLRRDRLSAEFAQAMSHTFVVKHDWAGALGEGAAAQEGDQWRLPYDMCCFEFVISGAPVLVLSTMDPDHLVNPVGQDTQRALAFIELGGVWVNIGHDRANEHAHLDFAWRQVRAVCIGMDAEVVTHTVERAPIKLNEKRAKAGKSPLRDFHVVDLARRHRVANRSTGHDSGRRVRLHYRRGHWRHYELTRVWIKWTMVGDPDLGFVAKDYAL